jgi:hypothetical protein
MMKWEMYEETIGEEKRIGKANGRNEEEAWVEGNG